MKKYFLTAITLVAASLLAVNLVFALSESDITFPVSELGGCQNEKACRTYCDQPDNFSACFAFAKKYNLLEGPVADIGEEDDIENLSRVLQEEGGPGNCKSQSSCETYCNDTNHIKECVAWAEKHDAIPKEKLEEAKRVQAAVEAGAKPPSCRSKAACELYCQIPEHSEECLNFAEKAGFIPKEQAEHQRRMIRLLREGKMPGGCQGKEACETYCHQEEHFEECIKFAQENGFASGEEIQRFKETGGKGPGGCRGREQCESYCRDEAHEEECFQFAKKHGFIKEEDVKNREEGRQRFQKGLQRVPPEIAQCLKDTVGAEVLEKIASGQTPPTRELGEKMKVCFEQFAGTRSQEPREIMRREQVEEREMVAPERFEKPMPPRSLPPQPTVEDFCRSFPEKCRDLNQPMPISPEEYCKQNPERCTYLPKPTESQVKPDIQSICGDQNSPYYNEIGCQQYRESGEKPSSFAPPTLGQFTVGLLYSLFTNLLK